MEYGTNRPFVLPTTGLVNPECTAFIGNGVVVHVPAFFDELDNLTKKGAFLLLPYILSRFSN